MGNCFSHPRDSESHNHQIPHHSNGNNGYTANLSQFPIIHNNRSINNYYKDDIIRKGSTLGNGQPAVFHVNGSHVLNSTNTLGSTASRGTIGQVRVIALYDYESRVDGDISFKKDDIMVLIDETNMDWWCVRHPKRGVGYVPRNFIAIMDSLEVEEWYSGKINRSLAEKLVSAPNLPRGTFLIRKREQGDEYALTINDSDSNNNRKSPNIKHYKIRPLDDGCGYFITTRKIFPTIKDLVLYYSETSAGLCCKLTYSAPKLAPQRIDLSSDTKNNWEIPREEIKLIEKLGDGNFGEVYYGKWRDVVDVAVKTMKKGTMSPDAFLREAQIMKQCNHPKLVRLYAVCTKEEPFYIITEYMVNGSLLQYLKNPDNNLSQSALIDMCAQIASGMMYLEDRKLVHRDLAARNVLVGDKISGVPEVKVADFGLARTLMEEDIYEATTGAKFPIKWTAIEAAIYGNFTVKSDVWSFGILLYEIFTRSPPYPGMSNKEVIEKVERGYRMPQPSEIPDPVYNEMRKCWDENPEKRQTFEYLHLFFEDYYVSSQPSYVPSSIDDVGLSFYRR